ncbi:hypothetical protein M3Y99_01519100 [Aphelenchoides fujianensis]|nr:hypothetical protein M3Y99_01519100 [Aphelenchoides fujianensis]
MTIDVGRIQQSNGTQLPRFGIGTWQATDPNELKTALRAALEAGYRKYGNEEVIGEVLQEYYDGGKLKREDLWITSKLPYYSHEQKAAEETLGSPGRKNSSVPFHEGDCLGHPVVQQLAKKYGKTPAQILLRHTIQQGISVVPKSTHANRVRENIDVFDFEISAEDQRKLFDIHERARLLQLDFNRMERSYHFWDWAYDHEELKTALRAALNVGYRYVDTAAGYGNEEAIGDVLQESYDAGALKREDVFITSKLPYNAHQPEVAEKYVRESLEKLRTSPGRGASKISQFVPGDCLGHPVVQQLAAKYRKTPAQILLRHTIQQGISVIPKSTSPQRLRENIDIFDFQISVEDQEKLHAIDEKEHTPDHEQLKAALRAALDCGYRYIDTASRYENEHVIGEVLQEFYDAGKLKREDIELHILWPQRKMIDLCKRLGITLTSFSTLGSPGRAASPASRFVAGDCLGHPVVQQLAAKYAKTPAQILLRHTIQQGISVIPKSVSADRLKQNIDVFDFELAAADQKKLADIDEKEHVRLHLFDFRHHRAIERHEAASARPWYLVGFGPRAAEDRAAGRSGRYIDTAAAYGNEAAIGDVLQEYYDAGKLKREDIFLTTKLPFYAHEPEVAEQLIQRSLKNLRTDYLDLYLIELHVLWPQKEMIALCKKLGLSITSYSTIGSPGRGASPIAKFVPGDCMGHPVVQELAKKYNKTPAQILLRHTIQQGISVIPKSTNPDRLKQNIDIFDFEISAEDQKKLDDIDEKDHVRLLQFDFAWHHPNFPFADVDRSSK